VKSLTNLRYLETSLLNQNCTHAGIKRRLKSGDALCHSLQNLSSSRWLFKNIKIQYTELWVSCCVKLSLSHLATYTG